MTKVKICGLTREEDIFAVNECLPEYVGFVFAEASRRKVSVEQAQILSNRLKPAIISVGVFVDQELDMVARCLSLGIIQMAQLHGREDAAYLAALREKTGKPVIRAVRADVARLDFRPAAGADYLLFDSGAGGTGISFDWQTVQNITKPFFLAGGITPDNVEQALAEVHPFAVDVSSGVETDGYKDGEKIYRLIRRVRRWNEGGMASTADSIFPKR